ncbi:hypothetical protein GCM10009616_36280 [Microlunatus lacustris]
MALLALTIATASLLGPIGAGLLTYRTSPTTLNQLRGSDAAALFFVVPLTLGTAVLAVRRHRVAPLLATGTGAYALYTYFQVVVGQEYLRLPGNVERFFPLYLVLFVVAEAVVVLGLRATPVLPRPPRGLERVAGTGLLLVAALLVGGLHLRTMITAWQDPPALIEYASSPTPFWMVKLMDLGIVVPAAILIGVGLLRGAVWARRAMYILFTGYTCLAVSVAAMGLVMVVNRDPDASSGLAAGFCAFAIAFGTITLLLYRPLFGSGADAGPP